MQLFITWTLQLLLTPILSPLFVGIIRKVKAKLQNRNGASIFQPYKDLAKLFQKKEVISEDASWIFCFAPYIIFASTIVIGVSIPLVTTHFTHNILGDLLLVVYLLAFGTFFLALAGMDTGNAFGGFGSSREMTIAALTEGGLIFSLLVLGFLAHSSNLFSIAESISTLSVKVTAPMFLAFGAFLIALLAETARYPFDNPATHLELTMIHEAMILEYSGKRLALIEWAAANKLFIFMAMAMNLFFPWGLTSHTFFFDIGVSLFMFMLRLTLLSFCIAILESGIAKYRFFRLPDLLFISFILSTISMVLM